MGRVIKVNFNSKTGYELGEVVSVGKPPNTKIGYIYNIYEDDIHVAVVGDEYLTLNRTNISKIDKIFINLFLNTHKDKLDPVYYYIWEYSKETESNETIIRT